MRAFLSPLSMVVMLAVSGAQAQTAVPINVFGTVTKAGSKEIAVTQDDGKSATFPLAFSVQVFRLRKASLADIQANDFIASAAEPKEDGTYHSTEVRIFPEALRGVGEGQRPMNDARRQTMTNASVVGPAATLGGDRLKVRFPGGDAVLFVAPDIPVVRIEDAKGEEIRPGVRVRLQGTDASTVNRITIQ